MQAQCKNFYPRPPRGGRREIAALLKKVYDISIHVLREEDDGSGVFQPLQLKQFLSTSSARRTTGNGRCPVDCAEFLSTSSARRTTSPKLSPV